MVLKQMVASVFFFFCLGVQYLEQNLNQNWEEPSSTCLQGKGGLIEMIMGIEDTRIRANTKISVTGSKKSEVISSLFFSLGLSLPSSLMVLAWQLSSLRLLHLVTKSKLPALGFYILKAFPSKERSWEPLEFKGILWMMHLSSHVQPYISHPGRAMWSYDGLYMVIGPDTTHMIVNFLQNCMTEAEERQPQG